MTAPRVLIQTQDFDVSAELAALRAGDARVGAVCCFVGTVRDRNEGASVSAMELEHYPGMTEKSIEAIIERATERFGIHAAKVIHRIGPLQPMDQIVFVGVTSAHRGMSFQASNSSWTTSSPKPLSGRKSRRPKARVGWMRASATKKHWRAGSRKYGCTQPMKNGPACRPVLFVAGVA